MKRIFFNSFLVCFFFCALLFVGIKFVDVRLTGNAIVGFSIADNWHKCKKMNINCSCPLILNDSFFGLGIYVKNNVRGGNLEILGFEKNPILNTKGLPDNAFDFIEIDACRGICSHLDHLDLKLPYSNESGVVIENLVGYYFNESSEEWEEVNTTFDENTSQIILHLNHLSLFAVGERIIEDDDEPVVPPYDEENNGGGSSIKNIDDELEEYINETENVTNLKENKSSGIPKQLFDITFKLDKKNIYNSEELESIIIFESFGTELTPVNLTFIILNSNGEERYRANSSISVMTEEIVKWHYDSLNLSVGKYIAILETNYNGVFNEFKQEFEIINKVKIMDRISKIVIEYRYYVVGILLLLIGILLFLILKKEKKKRKKRRKKK